MVSSTPNSARLAPTRKRGAARALFEPPLRCVLVSLGLIGIAADVGWTQESVTPDAVAGIAEAVASGAAHDATASPPATSPDADRHADKRRFMFNFASQPWRQVLEWFAKESDLALTMESSPTGTFNYIDPRQYTLPEAMDVLNSVLYTTKGYLLVRHDKMLVLVNMEGDKVAPQLVPDVPLEELDQRGEYELIRVIFPVWNMTAEEAAKQVQQLLGPKTQMEVVTLPQSRQIQVTELAGRMRTIRKVIEAGNEPGPGGFRPIELKYISVDDAMPSLRQALGIPTGADATTDNPPSARLTKAAVGNTILFQGTAEGAARLQQVISLIDKPSIGIGMARQTVSYSPGLIDPQTAKQVLDELFRGDPNVVILPDSTSGTLTVIAPLTAHATIRATLDEMQRDARTVEVIPLMRLDPLTARTIINNAFGTPATAEQPNPNAVSVDYDTSQRVLIVKGTRSQLQAVRAVLAQFGETAQIDPGLVATRDKVRQWAFPPTAALSIIRQIEEISPAFGNNRIRIIRPSEGIPVLRPTAGLEPSRVLPQSGEMNLNQGPGSERTPGIFQRFQGAVPPSQAPDTPPDRETRARSNPSSGIVAAATNDTPTATSLPAEPGRFRFVAEEAVEEGATPPESTAETAASQPAQPNATGTAPILIIPTPNGLVVASDDVDALDSLEELMKMLAPTSTSTEREFAVFYLRYSSAETAATVLNGFYGTTGNRGGGRGGGRGGRGGGGGLVDEMTSQLVQQLAGSATNIVGDLLSGGGLSSTAVDIVPLVDHNAVLIRARPADMRDIANILEVLDRQSGPIEDESDPEPRRIQVVSMSAADMAAMIEAVYADRIAGSGGAQSDAIRALLGGSNQDAQKMTLAVDTRNNQLIVRAPDALFQKVERMVLDLDQASSSTPEVTQIIALTSAAMPNVRSALEPLTAAQPTASPGRGGGNAQPNDFRQLLQLQQLIGGRRGGRGGAAFGGGGRGGGGRGGGGGGRGGGGGGRGGGGRGG